MHKVEILGICGSARKRGNSLFLLERAMQAASATAPAQAEAEIFSIAGKNYAPCDSCFTCYERGYCRIEDDFQELRDKWVAADAIIYSVPVII